MFALSYFAPESHLLSITSDHFESKVDTTLIFTCGVYLLWCLSADIDQRLAHSAAEQTDRLVKEVITALVVHFKHTAVKWAAFSSQIGQ